MPENQGRVKVSHALLQDLSVRGLSASAIFPKGTIIDDLSDLIYEGCVEYIVRGETVPATEGAIIPEIECFIHTNNKGDIVSSMFKLARRF